MGEKTDTGFALVHRVRAKKDGHQCAICHRVIRARESYIRASIAGTWEKPFCTPEHANLYFAGVALDIDCLGLALTDVVQCGHDNNFMYCVALIKGEPHLVIKDKEDLRAATQTRLTTLEFNGQKLSLDAWQKPIPLMDGLNRVVSTSGTGSTSFLIKI
jgi:hypothetical protein